VAAPSSDFVLRGLYAPLFGFAAFLFELLLFSLKGEKPFLADVFFFIR
jgi:hypothetical protein